jgi:exosortase D (VPLPA-CTERM-specific)
MGHTEVLFKRWFWPMAVLPVLLLGIIYYQGIRSLVETWTVDENYGYGFFVPVISLYLIWRRRERLRAMDLVGSWWGLPVVLAGLGLYFIGELSTLYVLLHLSLLLVLVGLLVSAIGGRGVKEIAFPLFFLLTMIPLPEFLYQGFSSWLQRISSELGVGFLQGVGVTAFREGNVIDLGPIQLQVAEACSGLRYLFPLSTLALICAYLYRENLWKRVVLFLSSFPIAIFLNGFRIGVTGLLVDRYGRGPAEGFFHSFSGWLLFVCSLLILLGEMGLLGRIGARGKSRGLIEKFGPPTVAATADGAKGPGFRISGSVSSSPAYLVSLALFVPVIIASTQIVSGEEIPPSRLTFSAFPMNVGAWAGRSYPMEEEYVKALRFDDYLLADYRGPGGSPINFYVAYYQSQRKGQSAHSPRTCIPGGGWEITTLEEKKIGPQADDPLTVNRAVIQKGTDKQVVYYWFQQRGRILTNEYLVKFYLFWDALVKNRTDGALVRLTAPVPKGGGESDVDGRLVEFAREVNPLLARYIPH